MPENLQLLMQDIVLGIRSHVLFQTQIRKHLKIRVFTVSYPSAASEGIILQKNLIVLSYRKVPKFSDIRNIAVIHLKNKQRDHT